MKKLNEGFIPPELRKKYPKGELSVSLADKTSEKFVPPPPPAYVEFSGQGVSFSEPTKETKFTKKGKAC
jgi:UBX domain-containing protein 1